MRRKFIFSINEYYHIYNRGTEKRIIFTDTHDYNRFILLLHLCNSENSVDISNLIREGQSFTDLINRDVGKRLVDIGAYCLMPNHFHLLIKEISENGISMFMKKILTAYSMYFNNKHGRTGRLFQGPFLATHANTDNYLKYLFSYIHLNPVKLIYPGWRDVGIPDREKARIFLNDYFYSSFKDYVGSEREVAVILSKSSFPEYFSDFKEFSDFINGWLAFRE